MDNYEEEVKKVATSNKNAIKKIDKDIDKLKVRLNSVMEAYELKDYTRDQFLIRKADIEANIKELEDKKIKFKESEEEDKVIMYKKMIPKLDLCIKRYDSLSIEHKNKLLKSILNEVTYVKTEKSTKKNKTKFKLKLNLKL